MPLTERYVWISAAFTHLEVLRHLLVSLLHGGYLVVEQCFALLRSAQLVLCVAEFLLETLQVVLQRKVTVDE